MNETSIRTFTLSHCGLKHSTSFRFAWINNHPNLEFRPSEGHLHAGQSKRIKVLVKPTATNVVLVKHLVKCILQRICVPFVNGSSSVSNVLINDLIFFI